jgi:UDP-2,3-diacylglucosamine pyrophosphatase LpxH
MREYVKLIFFILTVVLTVPGSRPLLAVERMRSIFVISDLHIGVGRSNGKEWHPLEDFRWPRAFDGFLKKISMDNSGGVDLVIAGDFLELWQHPTVSCIKASDPECGCSIKEMKRIVQDVIASHRAEFEAIGRFLAVAENRVFVIPGNHDAAIIEDDIWALLAQAVPDGGERFELVRSGTWFSADNKVAIEHGHQNAFDANFFPEWPKSVTKNCADGKRFFRPWGENFVQTLYNKVEAKFLLIDNLIPESLGTSIYFQYTKQRGKTIQEVARFVIFNLLQTSPYQKIGFLDVNKERTALTEKSLDFCRRCIGEDLILNSPEGDRYKSLYGIAGSEQEKAFRTELRKQVTSLENDAVRDLCERVAVANGGRLKPNPDLQSQSGCEGSLGTVANKIFDPDGVHALKSRINILENQKPALQIYVFGHTHEAKVGMPVTLYDGSGIMAFNSGAFQRLMDKNFFENSKKAGENDIDLLRRLTHDDMKPCYTTLAISYDDNNHPKAELRQWSISENESYDGGFLTDCSFDCSARPANCK